MAKRRPREKYIPFSREQLIDACVTEERLRPEQVREFRRFCELLAALKHHEFLCKLEAMKHYFAPFNPDLPNHHNHVYTLEVRDEYAEKLTNTLHDVLERASYRKVTHQEIQDALAMDGLISLRTNVDFDDFEQLLIYSRGRTPRSAEVTKMYRKRTVHFESLDNVVVLLKFKDADYFREQGRHLHSLNFLPGKLYVYMYKNIPIFDLEVLFPNLRARMNLRDLLLFSVPAATAVGSVTLKSLTQIGLLIGLLVYLFNREVAQQSFGVDERRLSEIKDFGLAIFGLAFAFGAVAFRQWNSYRTKTLQFQKLITETLFFKHVATNVSVFETIVGAAEEEECKEAILAYYHLLTHPEPLTVRQLDRLIENWFKDNYDVNLNFDMQDALENLAEVAAVLPGKKRPSALVRCTRDNICKPLPVRQANWVIDSVWDRIFCRNP